MRLMVCSLRRLEAEVYVNNPSHLISLLSPAEMIPEHPRLKGRHLRIEVNDIAEPIAGLTAPSVAMVKKILDFGAKWTGEAPLLIHCWAGVSRSSATAFILACAHNPDISEFAIAKAMRAASKGASPNPLLVRLADERLGRRGRMSAALAALTPADLVMGERALRLAREVRRDMIVSAAQRMAPVRTP